MSRPFGSGHLRRTLPGGETPAAADKIGGHRPSRPCLCGQYGTWHISATVRIFPPRGMRIQVASPWQAASQCAEDDEPTLGIQPSRGPRREHRLIAFRMSMSSPDRLRPLRRTVSMLRQFEDRLSCGERVGGLGRSLAPDEGKSVRTKGEPFEVGYSAVEVDRIRAL